jgi:glycosyltransferase involved in cell wall biosynthesis
MMTACERELRILAEPAWRNKAENPYTYLLSKALTDNGCSVRELTRRGRFFDHADVVHIHWPQPVLNKSIFRAAARSLEKLLGLTILKLRGAVIVWTVHNVHAHDQRSLLLEKIVMGAVVRLVDGAIFLAEGSCGEAFRAMPVLAKKPHAVIPHGMYEAPPNAPRNIREVRSLFGIDSDSAVIGFFGDIKPYKGLDVLLDAFAEIPPCKATLLVAGIFRASEGYAREQRARMQSLTQQGHCIAFHERRLADDELAAAIRASDLTVLPYRESVNSGFALYVLGLGARIVTSDVPAFQALEAELGTYWVRPTPAASLAAAIAEALDRSSTAQDDARLACFCGERSWLSIGRMTKGFYEDLRRRGRLA